MAGLPKRGGWVSAHNRAKSKKAKQIWSGSPTQARPHGAAGRRLLRVRARRPRGVDLRLKGAELGGRGGDLALQGLELPARGFGLSLSVGESPARCVDLALQAALLGRKGLRLALHRRHAVGFVLEPGVDGLQVARLG